MGEVERVVGGSSREVEDRFGRGEGRAGAESNEMRSVDVVRFDEPSEAVRVKTEEVRRETRERWKRRGRGEREQRTRRDLSGRESRSIDP